MILSAAIVWTIMVTNGDGHVSINALGEYATKEACEIAKRGWSSNKGFAIAPGPGTWTCVRARNGKG